MKINRKITTNRAIAVLISATIGVGVLPLPRIVASLADTGAPLLTLAGIALAFPGIWLLAVLGLRFPRQTIVMYGQDIIGKHLGRLGAAAIIVFFSLFSALSVREFGEVVVTVILPNTPIEVTVIVLLLLAALSSRRDVVKFSYIHTFYLPFIIVPGLLITVLSLPEFDILNLKPLIGNHPHDIFYGATYVTALFQTAFILTLLIPMMEKPEQANKSGLLALVISGIFYLLMVAMAIGIFGPNETKLLVWPTLEAARASSIPGGTLERLDGIFIIVWVISVYTTLYSSYYLSVYSLKELFMLQDHRLLSTFLMPFIFVLALIPRNIMQLYEMIDWLGKIGLILTIGYPCLLWVIAAAFNKRGATNVE